MYYLQVYGFYERVNVEQAKGISLVNLSTQEPEKIQVANFQELMQIVRQSDFGHVLK